MRELNMKQKGASMVSRFAEALVMAAAGLGVCSLGVAQDRPPDVQEGVQVLTRGPVHEAFAETVSFNPEPGLIVTKAPPPLIEEVPPDQRPEGANVAWIPGYWAWDDERNDFLWVSGVWRVMPPDREWVSGYWGKSGAGFQWMSGYWADQRVSETIYLPEPPDSVEAGPNMAPPSRDHIWAPGCWVWYEGRYAWRPGYWVAVHPEWIWVPSYYVYSPRGYVFCEGYWDYPVESRGILFAPVYFEAGVYARPAFHYSPLIAINLSVFVDNLFVRPSCHHYYFGDYYAPRYYDDGIYASFTLGFGSYGYDPIYVNERYRHQDDRGWEVQVKQTFLHRRDHEEARPPRTLAIQVAQNAATKDRSPDKSLAMAVPLEQVAKNKEHPVRLQPVAKEEKQVFEKRGRDVEAYRGERINLEARASGKTAVPASAKPETDKANRPKSPIVAKAADQLDKGRAPPKRPEPPKTDSKVEAKPRKNDGRRPDPPQASPRQNPKGDSTDKPKDKDKDKDKDNPKGKP
jgi:hypothetical protein